MFLGWNAQRKKVLVYVTMALLAVLLAQMASPKKNVELGAPLLKRPCAVFSTY